MKPDIERHLRNAPPPAPRDGLLEKLAHEASEAARSGQSAAKSLRWTHRKKVLACTAAAAALIAISLGYAAVRGVFVVKQMRVEISSVGEQGFSITEYTEETEISGGAETADEATAQWEEARRLIEQGRAEQLSPGVWQVTLAGGETVTCSSEGEQITREVAVHDDMEPGTTCEVLEEYETVLDGETVTVQKVRYTLPDGGTVQIIRRADQTAAVSVTGVKPEKE